MLKIINSSSLFIQVLLSWLLHPTLPCINEAGRMWGLVRDPGNRRIWQLQVTVVPQWSVIIHHHQQTSVHQLISLFNVASISRSCTIFWSGQWNSKPVLCYPAGSIRWTVIYAFCWTQCGMNNIVNHSRISSSSSLHQQHHRQQHHFLGVKLFHVRTQVIPNSNCRTVSRQFTSVYRCMSWRDACCCVVNVVPSLCVFVYVTVSSSRWRLCLCASHCMCSSRCVM